MKQLIWIAFVLQYASDEEVRQIRAELKRLKAST